MTAAQQYQAARARRFGPGTDELLNTVQTAAYTFGDGVPSIRTQAQVDIALATLDGMRSHLLRLREVVGGANG